MGNALLIGLTCLLTVATAGHVNYQNEDGDGIATALAQHFRISFCVLGLGPVDELAVDAFPVSSHPSKRRLLTTSMNDEQITDFVVTGVRSSNQMGKTMILLQSNPHTIDFLQKLSQEESISPVTWVLLSAETFQSDNFTDVYIPFDCEFIYVHSDSGVLTLTEIYRIKRNSDMETYELGNWTEDGGLTIVDEPFYRRRSDLKGTTFRAVLNDNPPYVYIKENAEGKPYFMGFIYEIWTELQVRINFRTDFDRGLFNQDPEMILSRNDADFALGRIVPSMTPDDLMELTQPLSLAEAYAFGHRRGAELDWNSYLKPFSTATWAVNFVWMIISSVALALLYRIAWAFGTSERNENYFVFTFSESALTVFRAICTQGSDVTPNSYSCRLFFLSIYLTGLVVTSAFSAALFSLLTVPKSKSWYSNLHELLASGRYAVASPSDATFHKVLKNFLNLPWSGYPLLKRKLLATRTGRRMSAEDGLKRLCYDKFFIFVYDLPKVLHLVQNTTRGCREKILPLDRPLFIERISIGLTKENPYKKLINYHLTRMKNEGIVNRIYRKYWPPQMPLSRSTWGRVTFSDITLLLFLFALGILAAGVIFLGEKLITLRRKRKMETRILSDRDYFNNYFTWRGEFS